MLSLQGRIALGERIRFVSVVNPKQTFAVTVDELPISRPAVSRHLRNLSHPEQDDAS